MSNIKKTSQLLIGLFLLLLAFSEAGAQAMEGRIRYLKTYNWSKQMASLDYISQQQREKIAYMWGSRSEWKVFTELHFTQSKSQYHDSEERAEPEDEGYSWRKDIYSINRNFETGTMHDAIQMLGKTYIVEDSLRYPDWKIMNDMKEVAGHICMNAFWVDTIKQQRITVWFALDMPVSAGPERLGGLPGIILEADYNDGALTLVADKIEPAEAGKALDPPQKLKGKKVNDAAYHAVIAKHLKERRESEEPWFWGIRY